MIIRTRPRAVGALAVALALLAGAGCASTTEEPVTEIVRAETAIEQAQGEAVAKYASPALNRARSKLDDARDERADGDVDEARRLAEEALVDARYAVATAEAREAEAALEDARAGVDLLRREVRRSD